MFHEEKITIRFSYRSLYIWQDIRYPATTGYLAGYPDTTFSKPDCLVYSHKFISGPTLYIILIINVKKRFFTISNIKK